MSNAKLIAIMGATATGKTGVAVALAPKFGGEIVSMDSRQVYRGLDIGTAKPTEKERAAAPHHLIDIFDCDQVISAGRHVELARAATKRIRGAGGVPFLVGGTGMYFRAFFDGLIDIQIPDEDLARLREGFNDRTTDDLYAELKIEDAERAGQLSPNDRVRIMRALELIAWTGRPVTDLYAEQREKKGAAEDVLKIVLTLPREQRRERIAQRTHEMFDLGWEDEVRGLMAAGHRLDEPGMKSLGYQEIAAAIDSGGVTVETVESVIVATQQYAKRQQTFFRSERDAIWVNVDDDDSRESIASKIGEYLD